MANTKLLRTFGTPTSTKTGTFSFWMKLSSSSNSGIINNYGDNNNRAILYIASEQLYFYDAAAGDNPYSSRKLRDSNAWYHIVLRIDTTQGTAADRCRIYINGEQETLTNTAYNLNENSYMFNANTPFGIGKDDSGSDYFNGSISHLYYCDGQSYAPTVFGETDSTTGEWKIKTSPSITMGNQGFTILKDGNTITDQSANSNNFSLASGTLTKTEDSPSNVFATINPLANRSSSGNVYPSGFANGNNTINFHMSDGGWTKGQVGTLAPYAGKYYWETKIVTTGGDIRLGIAQGSWSGTAYAGSSTTGNSYSYTEDGNKMTNGGSSASYGNSFTTGDIISFALDCNTGTIWCAKNGTWQNSATISEISAGTTTNSMYTGINTDNGLTAHAVMYDGSNTNITLSYNFGNGYFGTTAVSSAGTNASGNGIFEYDVPTGYTALSTKGLNT